MKKIKVMNYDLIVVGTSFASSFFLKKYLEKSGPGVRVLVLERGDFLPHQKRLENARKKPLGRVNFISSEGNGKPTFINSNPKKSWIFDPSFGGSSNCWTGCTPRFMPNDFLLKTKYSMGLDWPIQYDELEPYYCEAEEIMTISGPDKTPYPMSKAYPQPAHALSTTDKILQKEYGELYISQPTARSSISGKRNQCCTSSICHLCPVHSKFTIENGLMGIYHDPRVELSYQSQVFQLDTQNNHVQSVYYKKDDKEIKAQGNSIALGANAIFNAHILLNSGDANPNTGHYLSEQVGFYSYLYLDNFQNTGGSSIITANGFMLYDTIDRSQFGACLIESHNDPFVRYEYGKWRNVVKLKFIFEDIPQYENMIEASADLLIPRVKYKTHSAYADRGHQNLKKGINSIFKALPVENIHLDDSPQVSEAHILGTTRMHSDPTIGVVDKQLVHHQYRNLFVLGGSVFPTISPANPTLTLSALSLYAADKAFGA
jgi:choline dehydrogenase-like flavoprotein